MTKNIALSNLSLISNLMTHETMKSKLYHNSPAKIRELAEANMKIRGTLFEDLGADLIEKYTGEFFYRETEHDGRRQVDLRSEDDLCISVKSSIIKEQLCEQQVFIFDKLELGSDREEQLILFIGLLPTAPYLRVWTIPTDFLKKNVGSLQGVIKNGNSWQLRISLTRSRKVTDNGKNNDWLSNFEGEAKMAKLIKTYSKLYKTDILDMVS